MHPKNLPPTVLQYMEETGTNFQDLSPALKKWDKWGDDEMIVTTKDLAILHGVSVIQIAAWREDGSIPDWDNYGKWSMRDARRLVAEGVGSPQTEV